MRFADTFYFLALLNRLDDAHAAAKAISKGRHVITTTDRILLELADAMSYRNKRAEFCRMYHLLTSDPRITVHAATRDALIRGMQLFESRKDKDWSLTDCISFVIMQNWALAKR